MEKNQNNSGAVGGVGSENSGGACGYRQGTLPSCAPLAVSFVPMQQSSKPAYDTEDAIKRGTLFPGLDLPFMNIVNTRDVAGTPLGEVMALCFVTHELQLYLDTHPKDREAFETLKRMLDLAAEAKRRYVARYGPLMPADLAESERFDWLEDPWPWNFQN